MSSARRFPPAAGLLCVGVVCLATMMGPVCASAQKTTPPSSQSPGETAGESAKTPASARKKARSEKSAVPKNDRKPARAAAKKAEALPIATTITLMDAAGKKRSLVEFRGRPVALFFFCGCERCLAYAKSWAQIQRSDVLMSAAKNNAKAPVTLIVFTGNADAARLFAAQTGLDKEQTVLLPDEKMQAARSYRAMTCPRIFVVDGGGKIRYTNDHRDDAPLKAPAELIVSRTVEALKKCTGAK